MKFKIALHGGICLLAVASSPMAQQAGDAAPGDAAQHQRHRTQTHKFEHAVRTTHRAELGLAV